MPRSRERICLQDGIKLDLNQLARKGMVKRGDITRRHGIVWRSSYWGDIAKAFITADMHGDQDGFFELEGDIVQRIILTAIPRPFGGRQWYFVCPVTNRLASVLWRPNGANRFCSRHAWGRQVAYLSQFSDPDNRAHLGQAKIKARLIGTMDPGEWDMPPKPKWMRCSTYNRLEKKYDGYSDILDAGVVELVARLGL